MKPLLLSLVLLLFPVTEDSSALKVYQTDKAESTMKILGTSTLHDWEMKAVDLKGSMDLTVGESSVEIKSLKLTVPVEALKSGKSAMDANAYKALKYKDHPNIKYQLMSVKEQKKLSANKYSMVSRGKLTVAGETRILTVPIEVNTAGNEVKVSGTTSFNMSSFDVEAPSFMMGAVTTGDNITIKFSINYN